MCEPPILIPMSNSSYLKVTGILAVLILTVSLLILSQDFTEGILRIFIAASAKIAALLFSIAFGVSSFYFFSKDIYSQAALRYRPMVGVSFVVFHTAHLIYLVILQKAFHPVFDLAASISLFAGGMAYLFMYAMLFTTFPTIKKATPPKVWRIIHLVGSWWIWFIFFNSYRKNVMLKGEEYIMFSLLVLVLILRTVRAIKSYSLSQGKE